MKLKGLLFLVVTVLSFNVLFAQDDELPPPSSQPKPRTDLDKGFEGFKKPKKIDWSKFIIEPNFNLSFAQGRFDLGFGPYVGYNVWKGLYLGGGINYYYTKFSNIQFSNGQQTFYKDANFHTIGPGVFAQYNIWRGLFVRVKAEIYHQIQDNYNDPQAIYNPSTGQITGIRLPKVQWTTPTLVIGAGYNLLQSKNFFFPLFVGYNVLDRSTDAQYKIYPRGFVVQLGFINLF
jgi:hypothetical protein